MRYHRILKYDTANGPGIRTTIWFTGCCFRCPDCFNAEIQDFNAGKPFDEDAKSELFKYLSDPHVTGLSVLGGEPLIQGNELLELLREIKYKFPNKNIWLWSGFQLSIMLASQEQYAYHLNILRYVDYLVDGPYMKDKTEYHTRFRGSSNQIIWKITPITYDSSVSSDKDIDNTVQFYAMNYSDMYDKHKENDKDYVFPYNKDTAKTIILAPYQVNI